MTKTTVRDRIEERKKGRSPNTDFGGPNTRISTVAPGLTKGPINVPGGTVTSVHDRVPRLPCPSCGELIALSLHDLIHASGFTCAICQTNLTMDRASSTEALRHVQNFYVASKDSGLI